MFSKQAKSGSKTPARIEPLPAPTAAAQVDSQRRAPPKVASLLSADLTIEGGVTGEGELQIDPQLVGKIRFAVAQLNDGHDLLNCTPSNVQILTGRTIEGDPEPLRSRT